MTAKRIDDKSPKMDKIRAVLTAHGLGDTIRSHPMSEETRKKKSLEATVSAERERSETRGQDQVEQDNLQRETPVPVECPVCGRVNITFAVHDEISSASSFQCSLCGWILERPLVVKNKE
ncbi:MAG TPA: hypothetical protein VGI45_32095 [Terracidiphilus sp.]|jgi:rubredoxin